MNRQVNIPPQHQHQHQHQQQQQYRVPQNSGQPANYTRQQTAPVKKTIQHDTDVYVFFKRTKLNLIEKIPFLSLSRVTQSRSFQMLKGWISDSEKNVPASVPPPSTSQPPPPPAANQSAGETASFSV
jgi:glucan-binding YG repeat protein